MIDDERNDIYIHIDAKADESQFADIHASKSRLFYTNRVKVYWGNDSMIDAEYELLQAAQKQGPYLYYHLLSGVDLPLKTQDYIHHLLDEVYRGHEFVGYSKRTDFAYRARYYHLFDRHLRSKTKVALKLSKMRNYALILQKKVGIWRNKNVNIVWGPQWFSITEDLCQFLLFYKKKVRNMYFMVLNPDESFIQTLVRDTRFYNYIHDKEEEYSSCMRLIDWDKGPDYLHILDFDHQTS